MARQRKPAPSRRKLPWPALGAPIEIESGWVHQKIAAERIQRRRMRKLKEHYKIEGDDPEVWYRLALAIAANFDVGLRIIERRYKPPRQGQKWTDTENSVFICNVECERAEGRSVPQAVRAVKAEFPDIYAASAAHLEQKYYTLKRQPRWRDNETVSWQRDKKTGDWKAVRWRSTKKVAT